MANSRYAYVKSFELSDSLLPGVFLVFRVDGQSFHRFSDTHGYAKPNDLRALRLMDHAAESLMAEYPDIVLAFGQSDEYSFLLRKSSMLHKRRSAKLVSTFTSHFTSAFVFNWNKYFGDTVKLQYPPSFDGRIVLYPSSKEVRDYFAWRQVDTHINNLYNTAFWALVQQGGQTTKEAHATLKGTNSSQKHELLFSRFGINYNRVEERYRKGSMLVRTPVPNSLDTEHEARPNEIVPETQIANQDTVGNTKQQTGKRSKNSCVSTRIETIHGDVIKADFWDARPWIIDS